MRDWQLACNNMLNTAEEVRAYERKYAAQLYIRRECPLCGETKPMQRGKPACDDCIAAAQCI